MTRAPRTLTLLLSALLAVALFAGLVHAVLVAANVADPATATVYGLTPRRLWASTVAAVGVAGVLAGGLALARSRRTPATSPRHRDATVAVAAGLIAVVNGVLNLMLATGGPGTGNGVVGGAAAIVLGFVAVVLGALAVSRFGQIALP